MTEDNLKREAISKLNKDFHILEEVEGFHQFYQQPVRIDLMLKAKDHLIEAGFTDNWFGIEAKWLEGVHGQTAKTTKMVWQSLTYAQSEYIINNSKVVPEFVAVLKPAKLEPSIMSHYKAIMQLALYGKVGELYFYNDGNWGIKFTYIYARSDDSEYTINKQKLPKSRAGCI